MNTPVLALMFAGVSAVLTPLITAQSRILIWNASASLPIGLYGLASPQGLLPGDLVALSPPPPLAAMLAARGSLPFGVPLLKQVAAIGGQTICREGLRVTIDGEKVAVALPHDRQGRPLPVWHGCRRLGTNELFLINPAPDSFDSRYFGPLPRGAVIGRAIPLWSF